MIHTLDDSWRDVLHARFRGQPTPLLVMPDALWTAASLWAGTRAWTKAFRAMGVGAGDVVVCTLPAGPACVQVLLACLWDGVTFAPHSEGNDAPMLHAAAAGARIVIAPSGPAITGRTPVLVPDAASQPPVSLPALLPRGDIVAGDALRAVDHETGIRSCWSAAALLTLTHSVATGQQMDGACVLSVLPWQRPAELIGGVLAPLLHAEELLVAGDRSLETALRLAREHPITHVGLDATTASAWSAHAEGRSLLSRLIVRSS